MKLDSLGVELRGERSLRLGMQVAVKVTGVDVALGRIELTLASLSPSRSFEIMSVFGESGGPGKLD